MITCRICSLSEHALVHHDNPEIAAQSAAMAVIDIEPHAFERRLYHGEWTGLLQVAFVIVMMAITFLIFSGGPQWLMTLWSCSGQRACG